MAKMKANPETASARAFMQILEDTDPDNHEKQLEAWQAYLIQHLTFPFEAVVEASQEGPLNAGDRIKVIGLNDIIDDSYGLIIDLRFGRKKYALPLCDLRVIDRKSPNYRLINDFSTWFANR
jgi:Calcium binding